MATKQDRINKERNRTSKILWYLYWVFIVASIVLVARIVYIKVSWEPLKATEKYFRLKKHDKTIKPERGAIMDHNGKLLAISIPMYDIYMDCAVQKDTYAANDKGKEQEKTWRASARQLADRLPAVLEKDGHDAAYYRNLIMSGRAAGRRYVLITKGIEHKKLLELKKLPLFNEGRNRSGLIIETRESRKYPYGTLGKRTIGYVKNNEDPSVSRHIGIEGKYNYILHGKEGVEWMRMTDNKGSIIDTDSTMVAAENGSDIRLTLDIALQDIADKALRKQIENDLEIEGGCVIIMDVATGAIKTMVNLQRDKNDVLGENFNMAIGRAGEPGSVFKTVTMTTLIEDGLISLDTKIPTNHGIMPNVKPDDHIVDYERAHNTSQIPIIDGFKMSSNYVFRYLVKEHYGKDPQSFIDRLYEYKLNEAFDFDLVGLKKPTLPDPKAKGWSPTDLQQAAIGYAVLETPLHIVTFYNAIANDGKMMKPYLVESIERGGKVVTAFQPSILNASICSKATADTLTRALKMVTMEGTGRRLKNAKCLVAGKTGTARVVLQNGQYYDENGRKQNQGTFVGFFPADDPKYTAIVTVYSKISTRSFYGGTYPALAFKDIVDGIYSMDSTWGNEIEPRNDMPEMTARYIDTDRSKGTPVPDVKGYGLKDALFAIENCGYRCRYEGCGHVVSQSPAAGAACKKGEVINIVLK